MFVDLDYYFDVYHGTVLTNDEAGEKALNKAIRQINRIANNSIDSGYIESKGEPLLTKVQTIVCEQADFIFTNADKIAEGSYGSAIESRIINGVSVKYSTSKISSSVQVVNGAFIPSDLYEELVFLGLCYRGLF